MYKVKLAKAVRIGGKRYERAEKVEVDAALFEELTAFDAVDEFEEVAASVNASATNTGKGRGKATANKEVGE